MTKNLPRPRRLFAGAIVLGVLVGFAALPVGAQDVANTGAPPNLDLSAPGVAWAGFAAVHQENVMGQCRNRERDGPVFSVS
jgi:hypothetical protein